MHNLPQKLKKKQSFSFPSGHTATSFCLYGMLAWLGWRFFKRPLIRLGWSLLMLFLILMIGTSRVYNKEHHPSDALGGYLLGSLWLLVVLTGEALIRRKSKTSAS